MSNSAEQDQQRNAAAVVIQRHYRGHRVRHDARRTRLEREARWDDLVKQVEDKQYAEEQLRNKNDVKSRWRRGVHAAARLQHGDGLYPVSPSESNINDNTNTYDTNKATGGSCGGAPGQAQEGAGAILLDPETLAARRATFLGKLSMGVGKMRDEAEELPYQSKSLEQQHWLEMIDGKVSLRSFVGLQLGLGFVLTIVVASIWFVPPE